MNYEPYKASIEELKTVMMTYASKAGRYDSLVNTIRGLSGSIIANELSGNEMIDFLLTIVEGDEE